ncbi:conserved hypothetical protein [Gammaproteobacteria bacterium]
MPIPDFDHNLVLPPHLGEPTKPEHLSPYPCTTVDLCRRFGNTPDRRLLLRKFLDFRKRLNDEGLINGFQWLDGSFLEDIETRENRSPKDIDVVTIYWGYHLDFQSNLIIKFPEFANPTLSKSTYSLDHYPFDAGYSQILTLEQARYWILLFSHNRLGVWKGMLKIDLNTPKEDELARQQLGETKP